MYRFFLSLPKLENIVCSLKAHFIMFFKMFVGYEGLMEISICVNVQKLGKYEVWCESPTEGEMFLLRIW